MDCTEAIFGRLTDLYRNRLGRKGLVALHEPWFVGKERDYVGDCIDSGWVSSVGPYVDRFEAELSRVTGAKFAVATVNGTSALHVGLHALGVTVDDLVVCPALSFVATANAIAYCGAEPVFLDVDPGDLGLSPVNLERFFLDECMADGGCLRHRETGRRVAAVLAVHLFGHPAQIEDIAELCDTWRIPLVEDAAEALGSLFRGRACGTFGCAGILSFNGNKTLTTGGGGAILIDNEDFARRLKHLTSTARTVHGWQTDHDVVGFNYRMPNINAALGCAQLEHLADFIRRKRTLADLVRDWILPLDDVVMLREPANAYSNYWLNGIFLADREQRDTILALCNESGIQARACWRPLPELPMFRRCKVAATGIAVAQDYAARLLNIPSSPNLIGHDVL